MSTIFASFTRKGSVVMCWGLGVVDLSTFTNFVASATTVMQCGPHLDLEQLSLLTNLCTRITYIWL